MESLIIKVALESAEVELLLNEFFEILKLGILNSEKIRM